MAEALPRAFGEYTLQRRLGVGGMAETFIATRIRAGSVEQTVCLKRVLPAFCQDKTFVAQFHREARIAGALRHSNVVGVLEFGEHDGEQFIAMELVDGVDLRALLAATPKKRLPPGVVLHLTIELAYALEHAHNLETANMRGIVHRDLTPSNVLLSTDGEIKLSDFGVAKAIQGSTVGTASGFIKGKVPYMAPEQMKGAQVDGRVDLFSLGVVMYEALSGQRPFLGSHDVEVMMKIVGDERLPLLEVAPDVPAGLATIVEGLLESDVSKRIPSAAALLEQLDKLSVSTKGVREELARQVAKARGIANPTEAERADTEMVPDARARKSTARGVGPSSAKPVQAPFADERSDTEVDPRPAPAALRNAVAKPAIETLPNAPRLPSDAPPNEAPAERRKGNGVWAILAFVLLALGGAAAFLLSKDEPAPVAIAPGISTASPRSSSTQQAVDAPSEEEPPDVMPQGVALPPAVETEADPAEQTDAIRRVRRVRHRPENVTMTEDVSERAASTTPTAMSVARGTEDAPQAAGAAMTQSEVSPQAMEAVPMSEAVASRATVNVTAVPWGEVWVGSRYMGRAPVTLRLEPGAHTIRAGFGRPSVTRRIRVRTGRERLNVEIQVPTE